MHLHRSLVAIAFSTIVVSTAALAEHPVQSVGAVETSYIAMFELYRANPGGDIPAYNTTSGPNVLQIRSYVRFRLDPTPVGAVVERARVLLVRKEINAVDRPECGALSSADWDISTLVADIAPDPTIPSDAYLGYFPITRQDVWDVTSILLDAQFGPELIFVFHPQQDAPPDVTPPYRAHGIDGDYRPLLVIEYGEPIVKTDGANSWGRVKSLYAR